MIFNISKTKVDLRDLTLTLNLALYIGFWILLLAIWTVIPSFKPRLVYISTPISVNDTILYYNITPRCELGIIKYYDIAFSLFLILLDHLSYLFYLVMSALDSW
jgi:hypothetical protein